jgi:hypothetical protein
MGRPEAIKVLVDERETLWQAALGPLGELNDNRAYYSNETPIRILVDHAHSVYRIESPRQPNLSAKPKPRERNKQSPKLGPRVLPRLEKRKSLVICYSDRC